MKLLFGRGFQRELFVTLTPHTMTIQNHFHMLVMSVVALCFLVVAGNPTGAVGQDVASGEHTVQGMVTDAETGDPLPGVNVVVEGTTTGTTTNTEGEYELTVPSDDVVLVFSYVGYLSQEISIDQREQIDVELETDVAGLEEIVVVGYGEQRQSDVTGSVASVSSERLERSTSLNISQVIQGAVPGVTVQTSSAGAAPSEVLMIRGRNSIAADNTPLIVVDGLPYGGNVMDINPDDVESIEILKDASAAAIYGSRGSNGVILVTTKEGTEGPPRLSYDGRVSAQNYANLPDIMNGEEFYRFKMERCAECMTGAEEEIYNSGEWVNWPDLALRQGLAHEHNLSVSGGFQGTNYYISGSMLDVQGIANNDDFQRISGRVNVDTEIADWISIGTRSQLSYDDRSGVSPSMTNVFWMNPLTQAYDEDGSLMVYPWPEDQFFAHPLQGTLFNNVNQSYQIVSNNFAVVDLPFVTGLSYRINTGITMRFGENATYRGRDTKAGLEARGSADLSRSSENSTVIENILSYDREFGVHNLSLTGVYSYEHDVADGNTVSANGFPHDFIDWHSVGQADLVEPSTSFNETYLISQMLRMNYTYDDRYLLTLTGRRDGFSGFGAENRWGIFPSIALAWNAANEEFFPESGLFSELKPRVSFGLNGNQAVGAYQTIARLDETNMVSLEESLPGYSPGTLANEDLGWEASRTINVGLDFGILDHKVSGEFNAYHTNTSDLLLQRAISPVHGITSILQNIGETKNQGLELYLNTRNIVRDDLIWSTTGNISFVRNEIVELYGDGRDDVGNGWIIGKPISANYDWNWIGTWQIDEAEEAAEWGSQPGYVKLEDVDGDGELTGEDRKIIGQTDPTFLWGMTNSLSYRNFSLDVFIHGVHGTTKSNPLMDDDETFAEVRRNTTKKDWWTENNPTNEWIMNDRDAHRMAGIEANYYEDASFVRIKNIILSYEVPESFVGRIGLSNLRVYTSGRNLYTFTEWKGLDPELGGQLATPLQREFTFGMNIGI